MKDRTVIIGGGQAAVSCAAKLRQLNGDMKITIVSDERYLPYQRPPLSKKYATGDMDVEQLFLKPEEWYSENNITFLGGTKVTAINRQARTVETDGEANLDYDYLVLAMGSRPRELPTQIGGTLEGVHQLRGIDDADALASRFAGAKSAVIIGGGYIGLEAAAVLNTLGIKVYLVEMADRILKRVACAQTADFFRNLHEEKGVTILESTALDHLEGEGGRVVGATLESGETLKADFVLVGIGIIANDDIAESAGLVVHNGIRVNPFGQTSDPSIYACGDCANFEYRDEHIRLESVQNAIDQAECVAKNIAGEVSPYEPIPWFWSDQYDVKLQIAGLNSGYDEVVVRAGARQGTQSVWYFSGDAFLSVDAMNDPRAYMVGKKLLETGKTITKEQAADEALDLKTLLN